MQTANIYAELVSLCACARALQYLYIYFLPPVPRPANSAGVWHSPTFKTMGDEEMGEGRKKGDTRKTGSGEKGCASDAYHWLLEILIGRETGTWMEKEVAA